MPNETMTALQRYVKAVISSSNSPFNDLEAAALTEVGMRLTALEMVLLRDEAPKGEPAGKVCCREVHPHPAVDRTASELAILRVAYARLSRQHHEALEMVGTEKRAVLERLRRRFVHLGTMSTHVLIGNALMEIDGELIYPPVALPREEEPR